MTNPPLRFDEILAAPRSDEPRSPSATEALGTSTSDRRPIRPATPRRCAAARRLALGSNRGSPKRSIAVRTRPTGGRTQPRDRPSRLAPRHTSGPATSCWSPGPATRSSTAAARRRSSSAITAARTNARCPRSSLGGAPIGAGRPLRRHHARPISDVPCRPASVFPRSDVSTVAPSPCRSRSRPRWHLPTGRRRLPPRCRNRRAFEFRGAWPGSSHACHNSPTRR